MNYVRRKKPCGGWKGGGREVRASRNDDRSYDLSFAR